MEFQVDNACLGLNGYNPRVKDLGFRVQGLGFRV